MAPDRGQERGGSGRGAECGVTGKALGSGTERSRTAMFQLLYGHRHPEGCLVQQHVCDAVPCRSLLRETAETVYFGISDPRQQLSRGDRVSQLMSCNSFFQEWLSPGFYPSLESSRLCLKYLSRSSRARLRPTLKTINSRLEPLKLRSQQAAHELT